MAQRLVAAALALIATQVHGHPHSFTLRTTPTNTTTSSSTGRSIGIGLSIALSFILLGFISFYLGMRRERAQSWRIWQSPPAATTPYFKSHGTGINSPFALSALSAHSNKHALKSIISVPLAVSSSAPVHTHPQSPPVEAGDENDAVVRYLELPCKEVYEMGIPSPKKVVRGTWFSVDRRPWWVSFRGSGIVDEGSVEKGKDEAEVPPPPAYPEAVFTGGTGVRIEEKGEMEVRAERKEVQERKSSGSGFMDWTGLEYVRVYIGRKLSCRTS